MKTAILRMLRNSNENYISGQKLSEQLQVSRTTVCNEVNSLREYGYEIDAVSRKGYLLKTTPDIVNDFAVGSLIKGGEFGKTIVYKDDIPSTNTLAKELAEKGYEHGTVVIADTQSSGRGRRGRNFMSPKGVGIFMTVILKPDFSPYCAPMLTLLAALAVSDAIEEIVEVPAKIKWPNDIVIGNKKICGILTEMSIQSDYINNIVVGIGINVNNPSFPEELKNIAGSIFTETNKKINRDVLIERVLFYFEKYYNIFLETKDLSNVKVIYNQKLVNLDKEVKVLDPTEPYEGIAKGITDNGELIVEINNQIRHVSSGEVSVRGMYGYV
ncbi:biotin--[acetyl-CoA-carboxylase] ligase [Lachnobacterium bovis]|uniref:Bifunctional ligase/repressor BirA n=1 Tax=Lachnobacterium bovis TaxID=140626 RepID=A0A1H9SWV5_9FIRM|nr:biotin--[acetyl-CoA-carboxylase] ligase [Lachnobacterium bovis]SER89337.1 BirA family transcriptional regulator, biotin operon repressor / biotin-[acetyl-CoA-carboxylase] ligase [Lachnobacterium bovis]